MYASTKFSKVTMIKFLKLLRRQLAKNKVIFEAQSFLICTLLPTYLNSTSRGSSRIKMPTLKHLVTL